MAQRSRPSSNAVDREGGRAVAEQERRERRHFEDRRKLQQFKGLTQEGLKFILIFRPPDFVTQARPKRMRLANGAAASSVSPSGAPLAMACGVSTPTSDSLPRADPASLLRSRHFVTSMSRLAEGIIMHDLPPTLWSELPAPHAPSAVSALQQRLCSREKAAFFAPDRVGEIKEKRQQRLAHCCEVLLFLSLTTYFLSLTTYFLPDVTPHSP